MPCARCSGMSVPELMTEGGVRVAALRGIHCGDLVDRVILRNRNHRPVTPPRQPRTPVYDRLSWTSKPSAPA